MVSSVKKRKQWRATIRGKTELYKAQQASQKKAQSLQRLESWKKKDQLKRAKKGEQLRKGRLMKRIEVDRVNREISQNMAIVRSQRNATYSVTRPTTGRVNKMQSSWIKSFAYDSLNQVLYMTVRKSGKTYEWDHISPLIASKCIAGDASCTTDDTLARKRWWVGKNPSAGAAYWKYLAFSR